jgi:predicted nicotinamide N-methyase
MIETAEFPRAIPLAHSTIELAGPQHAEEDDTRILFWWAATSAAVELAAHMEAMAGSLQGKRVVELGCGLGLPGIAAGMQGADVHFTDYSADALKFTEVNAAANGLDRNRTQFSVYDWANPSDIGRFDFVIGAEILYDYFFHSELLKVINLVCRPTGSVIIAERKRLSVDRFLGRAIRAGFSCGSESRMVESAGFPSQHIHLFTLRKTG